MVPDLSCSCENEGTTHTDRFFFLSEATLRLATMIQGVIIVGHFPDEKPKHTLNVTAGQGMYKIMPRKTIETQRSHDL